MISHPLSLRSLFFACFGLIMLSPLTITSAGETQVEALVLASSDSHLANTQSWLQLGVYEADRSSSSGWLSAINSSSFFLAENGMSNPLAELQATIRAFAEPLTVDADSHAQCRFKGRYLWLIATLPVEAGTFPEIQCNAYNNWTKGVAVNSISLLYATGYLGNPASFYGHTLLKFNSKKSGRSSLLDVSVNYGAIVPSEDGAITYIFKGVAGGYDAGFSHIQYYFHNHNYGELELRDIWEYELALTQPQVDLIMGHLWELLGKKYTYFFFRKNCGYRMAEVLELIDGLEIIPRKHPYVYPQTIVSKLNQSTLNNQPAVQSVKYHPSRQSRLYQKYDQLTEEERAVVAHAVNDISVLDSDHFKQLRDESKKAILESLSDYFQYVDDTKDSSGPIKANYRKVLSQRFKLPSGNVFVSQEVSKSPHLGRRPSFIQLAAIDNRANHAGLMINIRPSYYDALDAGSGHVDNSELKMFEAKLIADDKVFLRKLDIVSVQSVNSARTGLPGDNGKTWGLKFGVEQQNLRCDDCLVARFQGAMGTAKHLSDNAVIGVNVGGGIQNNRNGYGSVYAKSSIFANIRLSAKTNFRFEYENRNHFDSIEGGEAVYFFEGRREIGRNLDLRLLVESNKTQEYSLSLGYYW
jgi:hypothetical protein